MATVGPILQRDNDSAYCNTEENGLNLEREADNDLLELGLKRKHNESKCIKQKRSCRRDPLNDLDESFEPPTSPSISPPESPLSPGSLSSSDLETDFDTIPPLKQLAVQAVKNVMAQGRRFLQDCEKAPNAKRSFWDKSADDGKCVNIKNSLHTDSEVCEEHCDINAKQSSIGASYKDIDSNEAAFPEPAANTDEADSDTDEEFWNEQRPNGKLRFARGKSGTLPVIYMSRREAKEVEAQRLAGYTVYDGWCICVDTDYEDVITDEEC